MNITEEQKKALLEVLKRHTRMCHLDRDFFPTEQYYSIQQIIIMLENEE
tara:strand:+ start:135 stop:281 length:147 start_codon:yes stop_codon:yes gene_type:complete